MKTLLERSKGSQLVIRIGRKTVPISTMILLSFHISRIRDLGFVRHGWVDIQRFMDINPGPFPLLNSLAFDTTVDPNPGAPYMPILPTTCFFNTVVNLREFLFHSGSGWSPPLTHFAFPNLVEFDFMTRQPEFPALQLLDFLEASPMLRTVRARVNPDTSLDGIPQERVVILPNVETLDITAADCGPGYEIMTHISCPSITSTALTFQEDGNTLVAERIFPTRALWNTIIRQYTRSPLEEVALELNGVIGCILTLQSSDATIILLRVFVDAHDEIRDEVQQEVFVEVTTTLFEHPQLANVKRFRICHNYDRVASPFTLQVTKQIGRLFRSLGPLDELTIYHSDMRPYFHSYLGAIEAGELGVPSPIKELTISHQMCSSDDEYTIGIVWLAQARHALGVPFERVVICELSMPAGLEEVLRPWVGNVEYRYAERKDDY